MILVVENGDVQTAAKGLDLGASDYIETPFDVSELIARIRSQLRRKRYSDRLRSNLRNGLKLAVIDPLTGIYNRRYASQHMNRVMERARETDGVFAVMMIDLDKFKSINDRFGHDAGDAVLREFSRRLQENIRGVDLVARFGGEEFFVAMPDVDQHAAAHAAERIRRAIEGAPVTLPDGGEVQVTVSIGVAIARAADCRRRGDHQARRLRALRLEGGRPEPGELRRPGGLRPRPLAISREALVALPGRRRGAASASGHVAGRLAQRAGVGGALLRRSSARSGRAAAPTPRAESSLGQLGLAASSTAATAAGSKGSAVSAAASAVALVAQRLARARSSRRGCRGGRGRDRRGRVRAGRARSGRARAPGHGRGRRSLDEGAGDRCRRRRG